MAKPYGLAVTIEVPRALKQAPSVVSEIYEKQLVAQMLPIAHLMVAYMRSQLRPGHGYDTGKLSKSLSVKLAEMAVNPGFDIIAEDVSYWAYVEFGHMTVAGNWWEGYHFAENALRRYLDDLQRTAAKAWTTSKPLIEATMRSRGAVM